MPGEVIVISQPTPNPESYKFTVNRLIVEGRPETYSTPDQAFLSPLARALFSVSGVGGVFFLKDFVTIHRQPGVDWQDLVPRVEETLKRHFQGP